MSIDILTEGFVFLEACPIHEMREAAIQNTRQRCSTLHVAKQAVPVRGALAGDTCIYEAEGGVAVLNFLRGLGVFGAFFDPGKCTSVSTHMR